PRARRTRLRTAMPPPRPTAAPSCGGPTAKPGPVSSPEACGERAVAPLDERRRLVRRVRAAEAGAPLGPERTGGDRPLEQLRHLLAAGQAREQLTHDGEVDVQAGQIGGGERADRRPARAEAGGDGGVDVGDRADALLDERVRLA